MPVQRCRSGGKPGYRWGGPKAGTKCYTYTAGNEASRKRAKRKAHLQGAAVGKAKKADDEPLTDAEYNRRRSASLKETMTAISEMMAAISAASVARVRAISDAEWKQAQEEDQDAEL